MLTFKVKVNDRNLVRLPQIRLSHVDSMSDMRSHPRLGGLINSNLAEASISRYVHNFLGVPRVVDLDNLPGNVTAEESGFLTTIKVLDK